ncbi:MAG: PAS domain-containing protein [Burkholderiaceae bacterium]
MRVNSPVIDQEYKFPVGETLVSTTDLKGRILYCNSPFVTVSGYARDELLGQPHNMIRHPDMPEEAFRDMWKTISSGYPWSAPVKNRRADGTYYWVKANVTPLMGSEGPVGYMSVRTEMSRSEIDSATALYRTMRQEAASGTKRHFLDAGRCLSNSIWAKASRAVQPSLVGWFFLTHATVSTLEFSIGTVSGQSLSGTTLFAVGLSTTVIAAILSSLFFSNLMVRPIDQLLKRANRMAAGDLTTPMSPVSHNLIGRLAQSLNQLNVNLRSIVRDARTEVQDMSNVSLEIASSNHDLARRTESQAASLEETAAAMVQMTGTVKQSTVSAQEAAEIAGQAKMVADESGEEVRLVAENMRSISESAEKIGEIIQVIDAIAF